MHVYDAIDSTGYVYNTYDAICHHVSSPTDDDRVYEHMTLIFVVLECFSVFVCV